MIVEPNPNHNPKIACLAMHENSLLVKQEDGAMILPTCAEVSAVVKEDHQSSFMLRMHDSESIFAVDLKKPIQLHGYELLPIKPFFIRQDTLIKQQISTAFQWIYFARTHQFCGQCGAETQWHKIENAKHCPACEHIYYPRISPVVLVLVRKGPQILLARSPHFKPGIYSALAGFVEPSESLEQAAIREVKEEVNIDIKNLQYFDSETWPFPHSLMIAFYADYAGGEIKEDGVEIEKAAWFDRDKLPERHANKGITHRLIHNCKIEKSGRC